jgi:NADH-quinone oxidoreductase subunit F
MFDALQNRPYTAVMVRHDELLGSLHEAQSRSGHNWLSPGGLREEASRRGLSTASLKGVASYYSMFSLQPRGRHVVRLCVSPVCRLFGSLDLLDAVSQATGAPIGGTDPSGEFTLETCQCLGRCAGAPAMMVDDRVYTNLDPERISKIIAALRTGATPEVGTAPEAAARGTSIRARDLGPAAGHRIALRYPTADYPADALEYARAGGWAGLRAALTKAPDEVVEELARAKVRGRGGAGFPTGLKERAAAGSACSDEERCERFVVCNADEGEPGTFKDRIIMERTPQLLIEGMLVSAYAIGARRGYVYIRGEYTEAIASVRAAIASARAAGYLGERILGTRFSFDLDVRPGAGSYLCGEELTLIESLEGKRGYPRIKPPFPAEAGLWGKPTLVNNVETLAALPWVTEHGADAYLALGTASSPGTKLFCLSGDVAKPGYGEWEMGVSLGELLAAAGGALDASGRPAGTPLAVLLGGAAGTFVPGDALHLAMDYDSLKGAGATLGSGAVIVLGPGRSVPETLSAIMDFFRHESCGKCVPCRVGTARLARAARAFADAAKDAADAPATKAELQAMLEAMVLDAEKIAKASLCPLGQSPILPLRSAARNLTRLS